MKSIAREYPDVAAASSGKIDAGDGLGMMTEENVKHSQLRIINRHAKHSAKANIACKEKNIRSANNSARVKN